MIEAILPLIGVLIGSVIQRMPLMGGRARLFSTDSLYPERGDDSDRLFEDRVPTHLMIYGYATSSKQTQTALMDFELQALYKRKIILKTELYARLDDYQAPHSDQQSQYRNKKIIILEPFSSYFVELFINCNIDENTLLILQSKKVKWRLSYRANGGQKKYAPLTTSFELF